MLKKHRKQLINASVTIAVAYSFTLYTIYQTISDTNLLIQNKYGIDPIDRNDALDYFSGKGIFLDIRFHYLILAIAISVFLYQTYRYLTTEDNSVELQKDAVMMKRQEKVIKQQLKWQGVGQLSDVPKVLLLILGLIVSLGILYLLNT